MTATPELDAQIAQEKEALANAPIVAQGPVVGRCGKCGRPSRTLIHYETVDAVDGPVPRYKGECCARDADREPPKIRSGGRMGGSSR